MSVHQDLVGSMHSYILWSGMALALSACNSSSTEYPSVSSQPVVVANDKPFQQVQQQFMQQQQEMEQLRKSLNEASQQLAVAKQQVAEKEQKIQQLNQDLSAKAMTDRNAAITALEQQLASQQQELERLRSATAQTPTSITPPPAHSY